MSDNITGVPVLVTEKEKAVALTPIERQGKEYSEDWLQQLLFAHPEILPASEFDEAFHGAHAVGREVPTAAGPIDLLLLNERGWLILVETKLWRNPESRREVVAQIVEYASAMQTWTSEDLERALKNALSSPVKSSLVDHFREHPGFDERRFQDTLTRNLQSGRFLLLVVGDGIREGVEQMADFLQRTPLLHYSLGLVELGLWRIDANQKWPIYVQPRVVTRTREIMRSLVTVTVEGAPAVVRATTPPPEDEARKSRQRMSEEDFIERTRLETDASVAEYARWLLDNAEEHGLSVVWQDTGPVLRYIDLESGRHFTLGYLRHGRFTGAAWLDHHLDKAGLPEEIANTHKAELSKLLPGAKVMPMRGEKNRRMGRTDVYVGKSDGLPLKELLADDRKTKLFEVCERTIALIQRAIQKKGK
ncbi:MAG: hypothetical protein ACE15C_12145 [Phycisphaerae bacterium]